MIKKVEFVSSEGIVNKVEKNKFAFMNIYFEDSTLVKTVNVSIQDVEVLSSDKLLVKYKNLEDGNVYTQKINKPLVKNVKTNKSKLSKVKKVVVPTLLIGVIATSGFLLATCDSKTAKETEDQENNIEEELASNDELNEEEVLKGDEMMSYIAIDEDLSIFQRADLLTEEMEHHELLDIYLSDVLATSFLLNLSNIDDKEVQELMESDDLSYSKDELLVSFNNTIQAVSEYNLNSEHYISLRSLANNELAANMIENFDENFMRLKHSVSKDEVQSIIRDYGRFLSGDENNSYQQNFDDLSIGLQHFFTRQADEMMYAARENGVYDPYVSEPDDLTDLVKEELIQLGFESKVK